MIKAQLPEGILFTGVLLCRFAGRFYLVNADRDTERGICLFPHLRISPVLIRFRAVNDRIKGWIDLPAVEDVLRFLVDFIADGVCVIPCSGNQEIQRLHSGITGALCHYIKEFPVWLGVQLIKYHAVDIKAVLTVGLSGEHLIEAVGRLIDDPFLGGQYFDAPIKRRAHPYHIRSNIKNDGGLLSICSATVDFGAFLTVTAAKEQGDSGGQL